MMIRNQDGVIYEKTSSAVARGFCFRLQSGADAESGSFTGAAISPALAQPRGYGSAAQGDASAQCAQGSPDSHPAAEFRAGHPPHRAHPGDREESVGKRHGKPIAFRHGQRARQPCAPCKRQLGKNHLPVSRFGFFSGPAGDQLLARLQPVLAVPPMRTPLLQPQPIRGKCDFLILGIGGFCVLRLHFF